MLVRSILISALLLAAASPGLAEWEMGVSGNLYYTDDVALFSATRRLTLHGDPTQPVLDTSLTGKGSDMVIEPDLNVTKTFTSQLGRTDVSVAGQAFVYAVNPRFNHGSFGVQVLQDVAPQTRVRLRYYVTPDLLLGDNESPITDSVQAEQVTSQIGSIRLEHRLSEHWEVRLLARYGTRTYNQAFAERNTTLWTIGPHAEWKITDRLTWILGYHYERGLADGRNEPQLKDDVSYINHFVGTGLEAELTERLSVELGFEYERNIWTTGIVGDERNGGHESVFQGEATAKYRLTDRLGLTMGFQRSQRKQSFETEAVHNTNVSFGVKYRF